MANITRKLLLCLGWLALSTPALAQITLPRTGTQNTATPVTCVNPTTAALESCAGSGGGGGGGAVYGPTAVGTPAANPPVLSGGTVDGTATGAVSVQKIVGGVSSVNEAQIAGTGVSVNNGTTDAGTERVTLSSDSTGQVKLAAGTANFGNLNPATTAQCTTLCASVVAKASAGVLYSFEVEADSTLDAAQWYVMIFNATSLPADGTVTPAKCYAVASGQAQTGGQFASGGLTFSTGITIGVSSTGCYSKTASTHAFIGGDYQ